MLGGTGETIEAVGIILANVTDSVGIILVVCVVMGISLLVGQWLLKAIMKLTNGVKK